MSTRCQMIRIVGQSLSSLWKFYEHFITKSKSMPKRGSDPKASRSKKIVIGYGKKATSEVFFYKTLNSKLLKLFIS